jgi:hypothetical protein
MIDHAQEFCFAWLDCTPPQIEEAAVAGELYTD